MFKSIDKIENHINNARFDKALDALDSLYEKLEQTKNDVLNILKIIVGKENKFEIVKIETGKFLP